MDQLKKLLNYIQKLPSSLCVTKSIVLLPLVCEPYSSTHPVKIETPERIDACASLIIEISLGIPIEKKKEKEKEKEKLGLQLLDAPPDLTVEIERNPQGTFNEVHVTRSIPLWFRSYGLLLHDQTFQEMASRRPSNDGNSLLSEKIRSGVTRDVYLGTSLDLN